MHRRTIAACLAGVLTGVLLTTALTATATPNDPCAQFVNTSNNAVSGYENYRYLDCRLDRQDAALKRLEAELGTTPSTTPSPSQTPSVTPSAPPSTSVTPSATPSPSESPSATQSPSVTPPVTPAPEPTSAAPAEPAACVGAKNTPGGADPWGGCWPGPQNTGYPQGLPGDTRTPVKLTAYTGPTTIKTCGTVIDGKTVNGDLLITAGNGTHTADKPCVTIRNSLVKGTIHTDTVNQGPVVITDTEVAVSGGAYWASIGFFNTFTWRVNSHGGNGTIKCQAYCESYDSWVHGMYLEREYHYNAFGGNGIEVPGAHFIIDHGYADCGGFDGKASSTGSDAGCSADIGFYGDYGPVSNITINKTFFAAARVTSEYDSGTQPGYCLNPGYYKGKPYPDTSNLRITNNVFERGPNGKCGTYGPVNSLNAVGKPAGNVWDNNRFDDGTVINRPEE